MSGIDKPLLALVASVQEIQQQQSQLKWSPPALTNGINSVLAAVLKIQASVKVSVSAKVKLSATAKLSSALKAGASTRAGATALSLGVGVSAKAEAKIGLGLSLNVGFSAKAALSAQLVVSLGLALNGVSKLKGDLLNLQAAAKLVANSKGLIAPGVRLDLGPINSSLRSLNDTLGTCQRKADAIGDGQLVSVISAELRMPRVGAWFCDLDVDAEAAQAGKIRFQLDTFEFTGTVLPEHSGMDGARAKCRVVAGNGHLGLTVSHSYSSPSGVTVGTIVRDILKDCGEDLSELADQDVLNRTLPRWHIAGVAASEALTQLATKVDASWRVLRDGTVWFGVETWPEVELDAIETHEAWSDGVVVLAPETPDMLPGTVYQGQKIEHVTHRYGVTLRTEVRTNSAAVALKKALGAKQQEIDFSREYPCKVVTQNPDGTLQLLPDDDVMRSQGLDHVPIRYGIPGIKATISSGARCHLAFAAGDPSRPFVCSWEYDPEKVVLNSIFDGAQSLSRVGDLTTAGGPGLVCTLMPLTLVGAPPNNAIAAGMPCMISFSALPFATPAEQIPLYGAISTGIPKFQG